MVMPQYGYKVAMYKFGEEAKTAVTKELSQMHSGDAFVPQDIVSLTH